MKTAMKSSLFYTSLAVTGLCFILSVTLVCMGASSRGLNQQLELRRNQYDSQQGQINAGTTIGNQLGPSVLHDLDALSKEDAAIKTLLKKHGYNPDESPAGKK